MPPLLQHNNHYVAEECPVGDAHVISKNDLTGKRFGRLIAMGRMRSETGKLMWQCKCDCGNECLKTASALNAGFATSCGCAWRVPSVKSGEQYGRLTAVEPTEKRSNRAVVWKCRCECGDMIEVRATLLKNGQVSSCGCMKKATDKEKFTKVLNYVDDTCIEFLEKIDVPLKTSTTGVRGVSILPNGRYKAELTFRKKRYYLGIYKEMEDAVKARKQAETMVEEYLEEYRSAKADNIARSK